ncbi:MAG TPA: ATP-binding cassette domain-containing protein [Gaiellaceae bacterium]|nr:ATP-binding cassette domain-containing protein [Gaiellaceae bacterium]
MAGVAAFAETRNAVVEAARDLRAAWTRPATVGIVAIVLAALFPLLSLDVGLDRLASDLYLAAAAVGLGIIVGLGGMPSLGQGAFVALGAFGTALLSARAGWPTAVALVAAALIATVAGGAVGLVAGRIRPALVAVLTWLMAWLVAIGLASFPAVSGGAQGIALEKSISPVASYEIGVAFAGLAVLLFALLGSSPVGVALSAARESRAAAEALGTPVARLRVGTFALGAGIAGLAGGLGVYVAGVADAGAYGPLLSAKLFIAVVLGGAVAPAGGLVGVAVLVVLNRVVELVGLESLQASRIETLLVAVTILAVLGAIDRGLLPSFTDWQRQRRHSGRTSESSVTACPVAPATAVDPVSLVAHGLTKRYEAVRALENVDLELPAGTVHALIGPNGSGKTTVLRILSGAVPQDGGTVVVGGEDLGKSGLEFRAQRGIVGTLQATAVFGELTVLENALVGARLRVLHASVSRAVLATPKARRDARSAREVALSALDVVGLRALAELRADELSGAAQRRLMIAAALATRPRVLLLDEPTAGASVAEVDVLADIVRALGASGLAIVLVEHNLRLVRRVADRVTVLEAGRTIATGTVGEVAQDEAVLSAYLGGGRF